MMPCIALDAISLQAVPGLPEIQSGDDLAALIADALRSNNMALASDDIIVVAQKVVSKSEGRIVKLADVVVSPEAESLAKRLGKNPAKVELILRESRRIVTAEWPEGKPEGVLITEHRLGFVSANAGIDESNSGGEDLAILLPENADASAERLRDDLEAAFSVPLGVIVTDSFGRPWRLGVVNVALGVSGIPAVVDVRGELDSNGRPLTATVLAVADEIAAAAGLIMGKTNVSPVVIVRGCRFDRAPGTGADLIRPEREDLFR